MNADERREEILNLLEQAEEPLSGSDLAKRLGVSRQIVVQDMALLRARTKKEIVSTYQGYILIRTKTPCSRVFKVRHGADRTREELQKIVDLGGKVKDVFVYHSVYGVVRGELNIASRADIEDFLQRLAQSSSAPLMQITDDFHYHTVTADTEETLDRIAAMLKEQNFLAPLRPHEPDEISR